MILKFAHKHVRLIQFLLTFNCQKSTYYRVTMATLLTRRCATFIDVATILAQLASFEGDLY